MIDTYKINIACEMVMIFILVFLLASCLIRLKRNMTAELNKKNSDDSSAELRVSSLFAFIKYDQMSHRI